MAAKYLSKWRPGFAERLKAPEPEKKEEEKPDNMSEGIMADAAKVSEAAA